MKQSFFKDFNSLNFMYNKNNNNFNYLNFLHNNLFGKNFIHTSAILYSNVTGNQVRNQSLDEAMGLGTDRLSSLQLVKYNKEVVEGELNELGMSSYVESFPWLLDDEGKNVEFNKPIQLFNGVKLISNYLEQRFEMDKNLISEVKITELLEPFEQNKEVTVLELFNHVSKVYNKDKDSFSKLVDKLTSDSDNYLQLQKGINSQILGNFSSKPLGSSSESHSDKTVLI